MKMQYPLSAFLVVLLFALVAAGCKKDDNNPVNTNPGVDKNLVGVWFSEADSSGVEIKSDGTFLPLVVNASGNLAYEPAMPNAPAYKIATSNPNNFMLTITGKSVLTGRDTSVSLTGTYVLSNNNNSLIITTIEEGQPNVQVYVRSSLGAHVGSAPAGLRSRQWR
ncbi:MAG: hypothetical protein ACM3Q4_11645 [Acidobacteriota bacterium]